MSLVDAEHNIGPIPVSRRVTSWGRYIENLLIAIDEVGNAITGGSPHETISSRLYRARTRGNKGACVFCKILNLVFLSKDHCKDAYDLLSALDW